jgi:hypothetical protein
MADVALLRDEMHHQDSLESSNFVETLEREL